MLLFLVVSALVIVPFLIWGETVSGWFERQMAVASEHPLRSAGVLYGLLASDILLPVPSSLASTSGQAIPSLGQLEKGKSAPPRAVLLPDDKDFVSKGWYVLMCDPSLPENKAPSETKPAEKAPEKP